MLLNFFCLFLFYIFALKFYKIIEYHEKNNANNSRKNYQIEKPKFNPLAITHACDSNVPLFVEIGHHRANGVKAKENRK